MDLRRAGIDAQLIHRHIVGGACNGSRRIAELPTARDERLQCELAHGLVIDSAAVQLVKGSQRRLHEVERGPLLRIERLRVLLEPTRWYLHRLYLLPAV